MPYELFTYYFFPSNVILTIVVIWGQYYFMRASWITPGQGQMQGASMKLSISALSCSGYKSGRGVGLASILF